MGIYFNKSLVLNALAVILVFMQSDTSSILIDVALIFIALGLAKINKDENKKFDSYIWLGLFVSFLTIFISRAFILV